MMRADDAAGERGGPGDEQDPAGPRFPHGARRALGEQERGARVYRQHLIELGGGDVLQRMEMAQPVVAGQHSTSTRARRFGGRLDELTGGLRAAQAGADRGCRASGRGDLRRQCLGGLAVGVLAEPRHGPAGSRRRAGACPMQPLAPVISATRPLNGPFMPAGLSHRMAGPMARGGRKAPAMR